MAIQRQIHGNRQMAGLETALTRRDMGRLLAGAASIVALTPAVASAAGSPASDRSFIYRQEGLGGTLIVGRAGDCDTLDPQKTILGLSLEVLYCVYDTLTAINYDQEIEGVLAESWDISDDGLEYTFHLRPGITYHDGTPFNAAAVKFAFDRVLDPATNTPTASWVSALEEAVVLDDNTVKFVLSEPFSPLLGNLASAYFSIPSPTAVKNLGEDYGLNPVGTGPFKFKEWVSGESITLEPNPDYHNVRSFVDNKGAPLLDQLVFRVIPEAETQLAALETGEINVVIPPPREVKRLQEDPAYEVFISPRGNDLWYVEFAMDAPPEGQFGAQFKPPFDDVLVRQAVAYGINADEMIANVLEGLAERNYGLMPTGMFPYKPEIEEFGYHYDPEQAKSLLEQAGWVDSDGDGVRENNGSPLEVLFWAWDDSTPQKLAQIIQSQLGQVGFKVNTEILEVGTLLARLPENVSNFNLMGWGQTDPDMLRGMTNGTWGLGRYHDEQFQKLVSDALKTTDRDERTELYFGAAKKLLADAAAVPLWTNLAFIATRADVKGYKLVPFNFNMGVLEDVSIEA